MVAPENRSGRAIPRPATGSPPGPDRRAGRRRRRPAGRRVGSGAILAARQRPVGAEKFGARSSGPARRGRTRRAARGPGRARAVQGHALINLRQGHDELAARRLHEEAVDQGQGKRQPEDERGPLARACFRPPGSRGAPAPNPGPRPARLPRPDSSLTSSRVEKPGLEDQIDDPRIIGRGPGGIMPLAPPLRTIRSRSRPRPSSSTRIATRSPS